MALDPKILEAITKAVHEAIKAVGGIAGLRRTSMFPSSSKTNETKEHKWH